jgi:hypothetical protein
MFGLFLAALVQILGCPASFLSPPFWRQLECHSHWGHCFAVDPRRQRLPVVLVPLRIGEVRVPTLPFLGQCQESGMCVLGLLGFGPHPPSVKVSLFSPGSLHRSLTQTCMNHVPGWSMLCLWYVTVFPPPSIVGIRCKILTWVEYGQHRISLTGGER